MAYSPARNKKLKKLGLPDTLFNEDFNEQFQQAVALHADLLIRIAELEDTPEWRDKDLPWRDARISYKEAVAAGTEPAYAPTLNLVMSETPIWYHPMDDLQKDYKLGGRSLYNIKKGAAWKKPPGLYTKARREAEKRGIDLDKLWAENQLKQL